jgi:hypothetical protein
VERNVAILNKITNPNDTRAVNCSPEPLRAVQKAPVFFGDLVSVKDGDNVVFAEHVEEDARKEGYWLFNRVCSQWFGSRHEKDFYSGNPEEFFSQDSFKDWVDGPHSSYWEEFFEGMIQLLEEGVVIVLWGDAKIQRMRKLFPLNKDKLVDLQNIWKLHQAEKKLNALINLQEEVTAKEADRIFLLNSSAKVFNPNEAWIAPPVPVELLKMATVSGEARIRLHSQCWKEAEDDDLEKRFMMLLSLQEPTCTVRQL